MSAKTYLVTNFDLYLTYLDKLSYTKVKFSECSLSTTLLSIDHTESKSMSATATPS